MHEADGIRALYDEYYGRLPPPRSRRREARQALRLVRLLERRHTLATERRGSYLDVGCGLGVKTRAIGAGFERAVGIDLSPRAVELAASLGDGRVEFRVGAVEDARELGRFDLVTAFGLSTLSDPDPAALARRIASIVERHVAAGGALLVVAQTDLSGAVVRSWFNPSAEDLRRARDELRAAGFPTELVLPHRDVRWYLGRNGAREAAKLVLRRTRRYCLVVRSAASR